jgi:cysteine desulfurase
MENFNGLYLDCAATTKPKQEVIDAMMPYFTDLWFNPSALYSPSVKVKSEVENSRKIVADFLGAEANEVYFTSGGSESNAMAIKGWVENLVMENHNKIVVLTTPIEHKSIMAMKDSIVSHYATIEYINVNKYGEVDTDCLERQLEYYSTTGYYILVSIHFANSEIGTIQKVGKISSIAHEYGAAFHVDATQAFGQVPINVKTMGIDMLSASGHKIGTPKGIGILYKDKSIKIKPLIYGSQMDSMRGGTENVPYIVGMAKAVELTKHYANNGSLITEAKRNYLIKKLESIGCSINGSRYNRLPNNINIKLPDGINGESIIYTLDLSNVFIASGSACNSRAVEPSYVLKSIGLTDQEAMRSIRITLSEDIGYDDIDRFAEELEKAIKIVQLD